MSGLKKNKHKKKNKKPAKKDYNIYFLILAVLLIAMELITGSFEPVQNVRVVKVTLDNHAVNERKQSYDYSFGVNEFPARFVIDNGVVLEDPIHDRVEDLKKGDAVEFGISAREELLNGKDAKIQIYSLAVKGEPIYDVATYNRNHGMYEFRFSVFTWILIFFLIGNGFCLFNRRINLILGISVVVLILIFRFSRTVLYL